MGNEIIFYSVSVSSCTFLNAVTSPTVVYEVAIGDVKPKIYDFTDKLWNNIISVVGSSSM